MKKSQRGPTDAAELRRRAEAQLERRAGERGEESSPGDMRRLVHELQVHQIELEMQNEELERARGELEAGLQSYSELYDFAPVGYFTLGRDGDIRKANLTGARMLKVDRSRLVGGRFGLFVANGSRSVFDGFLKKVFESRVKQGCDVALQVEEGEPLFVHIEASAAEDPQACRAVLMDVSETKRAEERVARERSLLASVMRVTDVMLAYFDRNFDFVWVNEAYAKTCNYRPEEMVGKNHFVLYPHAENEAIFRRVRDTGEPAFYRDKPFEFPDQPERGVTYWNWSLVPTKDESGATKGLVLSMRETTMSKRAELALAESEARYRSLFENLLDGFAYCKMLYDEQGRPVDFVYLSVNEAFARLTGLEGVVGKKVTEVIPGVRESEPGLFETYGRVAATGQSERFEINFKLLEKWFAISVYSPMKDHFVAVFDDVTGRKTVEAEREKLVEALREADVRKNEFLAALSHELRNPLAPIRNSLYILDRAAPGGEQSRRARAIIDRQVRHMTRLIDDLLDVARVTRGKVQLQREPLELNEIALRTAEDHRSVFVDSDVELEVLPALGEVWVNGDRTRLSQVISNLLQNAAKFTPAGGKTTVVVQADAARGEAILRVQDTGRGIPPELLPRLFEAFTQADLSLDRKLGGLGLGLSLVKGLVEMHGGSVSASSDGVDKGATFTVRLPLGAAARVGIGRGATQVHAPSRRVLIVEDNLDAADSLRELLTMEGHDVEVALTGSEGLAKTRTFRPDVVLCDIGLPEMDGYEVARAIRADSECAGIRLVALTGYAGPSDVARAREAGFDGHVAKPPTLEAVEKEIHVS